jgi:hypothetical protein
VSGPAFVGVGTPKSGTSWWYDLILAHPSVVQNRLDDKQLLYLIHLGYREPSEEEIETYREAFAAPEGKLCGEWSPNYLSYPLALGHLARLAPGAKLLVLLRDPVERLISHGNQVYTQIRSQPEHEACRRGPDHATHLLNLFTLPVCTYYSYYAMHLSRLFDLFDRSQVLVLQYESCKARPEEALARTYRFLGIDDGYVPEEIGRKVNVKPYIVARPGEAQLRSLVGMFEGDVARLKQMIPGLDLSLWRNFSHLA